MSPSPDKSPRALVIQHVNNETCVVTIQLLVNKNQRVIDNINLSVSEDFQITTSELVGWLEQIKMSMLFDLMQPPTDIKEKEKIEEGEMIDIN